MQFINDSDFNHSFFKDIIRINYTYDMPFQCINDYGYSYLMFRYGKFEALDYNGTAIEIPRIFVKGTGDYFNVKAYENSVWISVELPNHVLHNITNLIAKKCRNKLINLYKYVDETALNKLYYELYEANHIEQITEVLNKNLHEFYGKWNTNLNSTPIVNHIFNKNGLLSVSELAELFPYGARTIERMFNKEVGASPYHFIRLIRFNFTIRALEKGEYDTLDSLIGRYNYYDQSHFEKDFQKFLGQKIGTYKNDFNPLLSSALARAYHKS
jgi:AraC-like DNA-binding protein